MILKLISCSDEDTAVYQLPELDMIVDPRLSGCNDYKFEVTVDGTAMKVTRIGRPANKEPGWRDHHGAGFRIYSQKEFHYPFNSTKYLLQGVQWERTPFGTDEAIVKDGLEVINASAFKGCKSLVKVTIPDSVKRIEDSAFQNCSMLKSIHLPPNLQYIGHLAFDGCSSLEALYIPPTISEIGNYAFRNCKSLRIMNLPDGAQNIIGNFVDGFIMDGCHSLLTDEMKATCKDLYYFPKCVAANQKLNHWFCNRYSPLHKLCWEPSVSPQAILHYINNHSNINKDTATKTNDKPQFTPLHLLAANQSVNGEMIKMYLQLAPDVAVMQDNVRKTPLHILCSVPYFSDATDGAVRAYLTSGRDGKKAAFMKDLKGKTPFDYLLCRIYNKSFRDIFVMWYQDTLGMNFFEEGTHVTTCAGEGGMSPVDSAINANEIMDSR